MLNKFNVCTLDSPADWFLSFYVTCSTHQGIVSVIVFCSRKSLFRYVYIYLELVQELWFCHWLSPLCPNHVYQTANLVDANASEEDKIKAMMCQSNHDYDPIQSVLLISIHKLLKGI